MTALLAAAVPSPGSWIWDEATDAAADVVGWSFERVTAGLVAWVLDGVAWAVGATFGFIDASTSPNVTATWFLGTAGDPGPYRMMLTLAAGLLLVFVFAGIVQGVVSGDTSGMLRRVGIDLPVAVGGMVGIVALTQTLVALTDSVSATIVGSFGTDVRAFLESVAGVSALSGGPAASLAVFLLGIATLLAALIIFIELVVRSALIYLVVGLCPLSFAAVAWPATRGVLRRTLELLAALIFSKVVIALALAIGAAALGGAVSSDPAGTLSPPGPASAAISGSGDDAQSVTAAAGVLLAGLATFAVASFSPFVLLRLFPMVEGAVAAQGVRGGPVRTTQTALGVKHQLNASRRFGGASAPSGSASAPAAAGPAGAAAAGAASAAAVGVRAIKAPASIAERAVPEASGDRSVAPRQPARAGGTGTAPQARRSRPNP